MMRAAMSVVELYTIEDDYFLSVKEDWKAVLLDGERADVMDGL